MNSVSGIKIIFLFLLPLLLATKLFAQKTDLQRDNLKGKVKSINFYNNSKLVKTRTYNLNGFETSSKSYCSGSIVTICASDTFMFNSKGNIVKYVDDNFIIEKKYDDANNLIESNQRNKSSERLFDKINYTYSNLRKVRSYQTRYLFNSDVTEFSIAIDYNYDSYGNLIEEKNIDITHGSTTKKKIIYRYDELQNLTEKTGYNDEGKMQYNYIYKYDSSKRKIEYHARSFNGSSYTNYDEYFKYDEVGNLVENSHYEITGKLLFKDIYNFDNRGNRIKRSHYYNNILTTQTVDVFNGSGLLTTESDYKSNALVAKTIFTYDITGNIITALYTDASGAVKTKLDYEISYY